MPFLPRKVLRWPGNDIKIFWMFVSIVMPVRRIISGVTSARNAGLVRALAVSVALHALVMSQAPEQAGGAAGMSSGNADGGRLSARLRPGPGSAPVSVVSGPGPGRRAVAAMSTPPLPALVRSPRSPRPEIAAATDVRGHIVSQGKNVAAPGAAADVARSAVSSTSPDSPAGEDAVDAAGVRQYRVTLAAAARRFREYPAQALAQGLRGHVGIRVTVGRDGFAQPAALVQGSGAEALDAAALRMIDASAREASLPEALRGHRFSVDLLLDFSP